MKAGGSLGLCPTLHLLTSGAFLILPMTLVLCITSMVRPRWVRSVALLLLSNKHTRNTCLHSVTYVSSKSMPTVWDIALLLP